MYVLMFVVLAVAVVVEAVAVSDVRVGVGCIGDGGA